MMHEDTEEANDIEIIFDNTITSHVTPQERNDYKCHICGQICNGIKNITIHVETNHSKTKRHIPTPCVSPHVQCRTMLTSTQSSEIKKLFKSTTKEKVSKKEEDDEYPDVFENNESAENSFENQTTILSNYIEIQESPENCGSLENSYENCSSLENSFENPVIHFNSEIKESSFDESFKIPRNPSSDFNPRG